MNAHRLDLGDDSVEVWIEAVPSMTEEPKQHGALRPVKKGDRAFKAAGIAVDKIAMVSRMVASRLRSELATAIDPDEMAVELGVSVDAGGKILISAGGSIKVSFKWKKHS